MAQFRAAIKGQRGEASRLGSKATGITATVNGWRSGIKVVASHEPLDGDTFEVYQTSGSNDECHPIHLGAVRGGVWCPVKVVN